MSKETVEQLKKLARQTQDIAQEEDQTAEGQAKVEAAFDELKEVRGKLDKLQEEKEKRAVEYEAKIEGGVDEIKRQYHDPRAKGEKIERMRQLGDGIKLAKLVNAVRGSKGLDPVNVDKIENQFKALDTGTGGSGSEWIPTDWSPNLIDIFELPQPELSVFPRFDMPSDPFTRPQKSAHATAYVIGENTSITSSDVTTANVTFASVKFAARSEFSYELDEDSIVAIMPMIREDLNFVIGDGVASAIQNGDTSASHQDTGTSYTSTSPEKHFDGLRYYGLNSTGCSTDLSSSETAAGIASLRASMGKYGVQPRRLALFTSPDLYLSDLLTLAETETVDKYGPQAAINTGELGSIYGMPIYVSDNVRADLNTSGIYDGSTTTEGCIIITMPSAWNIGVRRSPMIEVDRTISTQTMEVVGSMRYEFEELYPANEKHTVIGYAWTP